jgi:hypothetical protein
MRYYSWIFLFAAGLCLSFSVKKGVDADCRSLYNKVIASYDQSKEGPVYMKFNSQSFANDEAGPVVMNEVWVNKGNAVFKNELITVVCKMKEQAFIMHSTKKILLKKTTGKDAAPVPQGITYSYDTLKKYALDIQCSNPGNEDLLSITLPSRVGKAKNNLSKVVYHLDQKDGTLKKVEMDYFGEDKRRDTYQYLAVSHAFDNGLLPESLEAFVYTKDKKLKPEFKGYDIQDQRTNDFLKNKK